MRCAIFADIHSNLEAFEAVKKDFNIEKINKYLCAGDIVGYGANPGECIAGTKEIASVIVAGNHDWAAVEKFDINNLNPYAREAVLWTRLKLTDNEKNFLYRLPLMYKNEFLTLVHASLACPEAFDYVLNTHEARQSMKSQTTTLCFIGHSHVPAIYIKENGRVDIIKGTSKAIKIKKENMYLINAGSVGQPRDGDPRSSYCIFDSEKETISIKRVEYNIKKAHDKILAEGLPPILAYRLLEGK